ncbi:MAG: insulinase family protein [Bacteroidetes bacterium]|nr:insulinase family protein [Bacteroidota bacterium]
MKRYVFLFAAGFLTVAGLQAQAKLVEKVESKPGELVIPYEKYVYPNGLTLMVTEDHSDPVAHLNITYHVGSAREVPGKSGFAHFFEHMLFQGSKHVADEEHFELIRRYGGEVNGNTTRDRTAYIETFPSNFTETALWMEADRMGFLLEAFTNKKFENQRSTVKNEKDQRYSNPYGFLMEVKDQNLYPQDHPYSWSTIGYVDDLDRVDSSDLRNFFLRWYGPNNACIVISGDVNTQDVVNWVDKYFGGIARGPEVKKQRVKPVQLTENGLRSYPDPNAYVPLIYTTYPAAPVGHADEAALDYLAYMLSGTRKSPLYKKFIDAEWALQVNASNNPLSPINHELAGEFSFTVAGYPWSDIKRLQVMLQNSIDSFEITGFTDEDLERAKTSFLSNFSSGLENVDTKAQYLSTFWYLDAKGPDGKMHNLNDEVARYKNVTREDIMNAYRKYIKGKFSSTIVIEPQQVAAGEKKPKYVSFNPNAGYKNPVAEAEYKNLVQKPVVDNFDRSIQPKPSAPKTVAIPKIYRKSLDNGLEILGTEFNETPKVIIQISTKGGRLLEGKEFPYGTADMVSACMSNGTAKHTPEELEQEMEKLGASISVGATGAFLSCDKDKLDASLALLNEMMFEPRWDEKEFKKDKKRMRENAKSGLRNRSTGAANAWKALMYGNSPMGTYVGANDYEAITMEQCKAFYKKNFAPELSKVVVVGPVGKEEILGKLAFLGKWEKKGVSIPKPTVFPEFQSTQIFGVEYIDADQSDIMMGFRSMPYDATGEFFKSYVMNFALGGNFNSRLNLDIREDKGWTYGINSGYRPAFEDIPGYYMVSAGVKANATDSAIKQVMTVLEKYRNEGITQEEYNFTKEALLASEALEYESVGQKAGFIMNMATRNLPEDYSEQQSRIVQTITREELNQLAKKNLKTDQMIIVVSGDMLLLKSRLDKLGYGKVQMLDNTGKGKYKIAKPKKSKHDKNYK